MVDLDDAVAGMAVGAAIEAEGGGGSAAVEAEHVALAAGGVRVERTRGEEMGGEEGLQPRRHQRRRHPPHHHRRPPPDPTAPINVGTATRRRLVAEIGRRKGREAKRQRGEEKGKETRDF